MHKSSMLFMQRFVELYARPLLGAAGSLRVADVGSMDVNGSYKPLFAEFEYVGMDLELGPNVDRIVFPDDFGDEQFDVVISGQVLEHVEDMHAWRDALLRIVKPGGLVCVIAPHVWPCHRHPVDCWRILPDGMRWLFKSLKIIECEMGATDTVLVARKD